MLKYTRHPFIDVGIATITAFVRKRDPEQLTEADLDLIADYIEREYVRQPLKSFLTVAFTSNAWFCQDAYNPDKPNLSEEERQTRRRKRELLAEAHLRQWSINRVSSGGDQDVFLGGPITTVELSGKLQPGKAARAQIPLTFGDTYINFFAEGDPGLPVSGLALLALQAFPLGCAKCAGRLLAVHSDNPRITQHFAGEFLVENRSAVQLAQASGSSKLPETRFSHRTLLIDVLLRAYEKQREAHEDDSLFSLTAYHLTNSGQGADLNLYHLPMQTIVFLREMSSAHYAAQWEPIVRRAWEVPPQGKKGAEDFAPRKNWLYEDLFDLPQNAARFVRTYFLRAALRYAQGKTDPRTGYSLQDEAILVSWSIIDSFLRRIMGMEKERVEQIRQLGDALADYVARQNDRRFFRDFFTVQRYDFFRTALIKANLAYVRSGKPPFITLEPYIAVFEEGDGVAQMDWRLARDLVLIRMVEQLYQRGWFQSNAEVLSETVEATVEE
ncbi:MAG: type I-B CRISPR-associated protein Cas8b1/Cst1 [Anaerolineae bacterium]|nr:type I-B CRISPR-associated protein Cas8b1/Cst1 [Anaerolineae bacterium]